jgi:hypothetical protein
VVLRLGKLFVSLRNPFLHSYKASSVFFITIGLKKCLFWLYLYGFYWTQKWGADKGVFSVQHECKRANAGSF